MQSTPLVMELYHGRNKTKVRLQFPFFILFIHPNLCVAYHFLGGCFLCYVHLYLYFHVFICSQMWFMMVL